MINLGLDIGAVSLKSHGGRRTGPETLSRLTANGESFFVPAEAIGSSIRAFSLAAYLQRLRFKVVTSRTTDEKIVLDGFLTTCEAHLDSKGFLRCTSASTIV